MGRSSSRFDESATQSAYGCWVASWFLISVSEMIRSDSVSTRNIRPGVSRPRPTMSSSGRSTTPISLASTTVSEVMT
ncbi:Uncharacterised protein [Mycobacteroides abscessus subsp. abscessus]|nr:Uncharacterised protein [Mycobacteroides abscessus subsp. abscessus]